MTYTFTGIHTRPRLYACVSVPVNVHATCTRTVHILHVAWLLTLYTLWRQRSCHSCVSAVKNTHHFPKQDAGDLQHNLPECHHPINLDELSTGGWLQNYISAEPELHATFWNTDKFHFYSLCSTSLLFTLLERAYKTKLLWRDRALYALL